MVRIPRRIVFEGRLVEYKNSSLPRTKKLLVTHLDVKVCLHWEMQSCLACLTWHRLALMDWTDVDAFGFEVSCVGASHDCVPRVLAWTTCPFDVRPSDATPITIKRPFLVYAMGTNCRIPTFPRFFARLGFVPSLSRCMATCAWFFVDHVVVVVPRTTGVWSC